MLPGRTLCERYVLERELGRGSKGIVFAGRDQLLEREVAIKLIDLTNLTNPIGDPGELEPQLRREAKQAASLHHPGVVPIYDFGRDDELLFLIMPLIQGRSLRELLDEGPLAIPLLAEIGRQLALALAYGHGRAIVHGDVKPSNVILTPDDEGVAVCLTDFGLAQLGDTSPYLAPEQVRGESVDARSDLYALGAVLYECAAGRPPFSGDRDALLEAIPNEAPPRPGSLRPELPGELEALIASLLAKQPSRRPSNAREVAERLEPYADAGAATSLLSSSHASGSPLEPTEVRSALLHDAVGRDEILRAIDPRLTAARSGSLQLILLAGEAGIGKTTVLDELALACQQRELELLRTSATADEHGGWRGPFGELLTAGLAQRPEAIELLAPYAARLVELFPGLARSRLGRHAHEPRREPSWAGLEPVDGGGSRLLIDPAQILAITTRSSRERSGDLLVRAFTALVANGRPLTLAIDDAHLSGETVTQIELLFRRLPRAPLVFIVAFDRSELRGDHPLARLAPRLAHHPRALTIELAPLDEGVHQALVMQLLGGGQLDAGLAAQLFHESGGRPLYARELIRAAIDGGVLIQRDGTWRLDVPRWPIPRQLRAGIEARLRRLPSQALAALRMASVLATGSDQFDFEELLELQGRERSELEHLLERAIERKLLVESRGGDRITLRFTSELLRRIVHEGLAPEARRKLHLHCAERLRRLPFSEQDAERKSQAILTHLIAGEALVEARPLVVALAHEALEERRPERALSQLARLIELADALPPAERGELYLLLAELEQLRGETDAAVAALQHLAAAFEHGDDARLARLGERGAELANQLDRRELADRLLGLRPRDRRVAERQRRARAELAALRPATSSRSMQIGDLLLMHGEYTAARKVYDTARRRAAAEGDRNEEARQLQRLARVASRLGHYETAIGYCREGLQLLAGRRSLERVGLWALAAFAHVVAGHPDRAEAELEAGAAELATFPSERGDDRDRVAAELERSRGNYLMARGDALGAIDAYERCLALSPANDRWTQSVARFHLGQACALAGHANRALRELERAAADKRAIGDREGLAYAQLARVQVLRDLGQIDDASESLDEARELADEIEDPRLFAQVQVELGRIALLGGKLDVAAQAARGAKDMARGTGAAHELGSAHELLAAIDLARADHGEARRHAAKAVASAELHKLDRLLIGALLILAEAGEPERRPELLSRARAASEALANPYRELDVSLTSLRLGLGDPNHAGDDYVALEQLSVRAEALGAQRHVGLCLLAQAEVLAPHDPRGALDHARLGEAQLRVLGIKLEADRAGELIARLTLR
ncbi:MAG TPA: protein kinase [Enhygromyxa sp.]|nr:protein kinase [Enhygromyxa sp.]